ncbi:hypothetical protein [Brevibacillus humidisoli]|nr:hypothetical protein [Brevibacillus humidisoli]
MGRTYDAYIGNGKPYGDLPRRVEHNQTIDDLHARNQAKAEQGD